MEFIPAIIAFFAVTTGIALLAPFAKKWGLVDIPDDRKHHKNATPLIGGLVIFATIIPFLVASPTNSLAFIAGLTILLLTGVIDDRNHIRALYKFIIQIAVACALVFLGDTYLPHLGHIFTDKDLGLNIFTYPFAIAAIVLLINAMNLIDGVDGLGGGSAFVILLWLTLAGATNNDTQTAFIILPILSAIAGFLIFNMQSPFRKNAKIFLGDAGSMCLGLTIAFFAIHMAKTPNHATFDPVLPPIGVAWILAYPIMDTCAQFYRRTREGRHPFSADRGHFHHRLLNAGATESQTTWIILTIQILFGAIGFLTIHTHLPLFIWTYAWIGLLFFHIGFSKNPDRYSKLLNKVFNKS